MTESVRRTEPRVRIAAFGPHVASPPAPASHSPTPTGRELTISRSQSLQKSLAPHAREHYPTSTHGIYATDSDSAIAILLVANKYSPNNFWYPLPLPRALPLRVRRTLTTGPQTGTAAGAHPTP